MDRPADQAPMATEGEDFSVHSGSILERTIFNHRLAVLLLFLAGTIFFCIQTTHVKLNASYESMIPTHQPFIENYLRHSDDLQSRGNALRIAVQANQGSILSARYLKTLQKINDTVYLLPNVDRAFMESLWTPNTRWRTVVKEGFQSGPIIGPSYDGSSAQLSIVASNIARANLVGSLVSDDFTSSMIYVPLLQHDGITGKNINYGQLANELNALRKKYAKQGVTLHIIGFAMVVGDMIHSIDVTISFFAISVLIATVALFWFTRCIRSTLLVVTASLIAVIWQIGALPLFGFDLTPYSVLVPFLVFAIGMSHGAQKMNGVMQDIGRGLHPLIAARYTFRRLFLAGFAALVCDATSFAVLLTINIAAIRELAVLASFGVAVLVFTNLIMLPISLSYTGVNQNAARRSLRETEPNEARVIHPIWSILDKFTTKPYAASAIFGATLLGLGGLYVGRNVQVGDLAQGAPELRQTSIYNQDNAYILKHYSTSSDTLIVFVDTPPGDCLLYPALNTMARLGWALDQMPQVQSTDSLGQDVFEYDMQFNEDSPKWYQLVKNQDVINEFSLYLTRSQANFACSFAPIYVSLRDHKAATLSVVLDRIENFIRDPRNQGAQFKMSLAGGNAGIEAATNIVVRQANTYMLFLVYVTVIGFCFIVFRSWRAVLCAVLPLILTSILAQALMVWLGIGIKVATLPVVALGVGIGVDYALYVLSITLKHLNAGASLSEAYYRTLLFTGKIVILTGFTLAAGVAVWSVAPIKFQADMGVMLSFMFLWNMLGAMVLVPSLAYFLLSPKAVVSCH